MRHERSRPLDRTGSQNTEGDERSTPSSLPAALERAEEHARQAGRLVEWAAVVRPELDRTARLIYVAAARIRGDRMVWVAA